MTVYGTAVFDLDGTLLDSLPDIMRVGNGLLAQRGLAPRSRGQYRAAVGMGIEELYRVLLGSDGTAELIAHLASEASSAHERVIESTAVPYPGIPELLGMLSHLGVRMGVLSNKPHGAVIGSVARFFPGTRFAAVRGAFPGRQVKPGAETVLSMLEEMGAEPAETLMIGDGEADMLVAGAAGMVSVGCTWGFTSEERLKELGARHLARRPEDIGKIVRSGMLSP